MENIRKNLYAANGSGARKIVREQASVYERMTLSSDVFLDEFIDLIIEILSVEELSSKPGIDEFLMKISTDMERLSEKQKQRMLDAVCEHYGQYKDTELCWLLGDLIARNYDQAVALNAFQRMFGSATDQGKEGIVLGLDILAKHSKRDPRLMKAIDALLGKS